MNNEYVNFYYENISKRLNISSMLLDEGLIY